jgi:hypothetical protein
MEKEFLLLKYYLMTQSPNSETRVNGYIKLLPFLKENGFYMYYKLI